MSRLVRAAVVLCSCFLPASGSFAQPLLTYAGGGTDDGKPATTIGFQSTRGVAIDASGDIYVVDGDAARVRKIDVSTGLISTVAGTGRQGYGGDGGPATRATFSNPTGVAVDGSGNVFVADTGNNRVRRVDAATGLVQTIAGGGTPADGIGDGGPATAAAIDAWGISLDGRGNLFVGGRGTSVRKVNLASGIITTVAGTGGTAGFAGDGGPATAALLDTPLAVVADAAGNVYVADSNNNRIRRVDAATGLIDTLAGTGAADPVGDGGPATQAGLAYPIALALDAAGANLYVLDTFHARVRKVALSARTITTVAGTTSGSGPSGDGGPATEATIGYYPLGLTLDAAGNVYVGDSTVRKVTAATGIISTVAGGGTYVGDGLPATQAILRSPQGLAIDPRSGNLLVVDPGDNRVREVAAGSRIISTRAGDGSYSTLGGPIDVAVDGSGNVYMANGAVIRQDAQTGAISLFAGGGNPPDGVGDGGPATGALLYDARGVGVDGAGNVYIADFGGNRVRRVDAATHVITTVAGSGKGAGVYAGGDFSGDGGPATLADVRGPHDVAVDSTGNVYFVDSGNFRVRRVDRANGVITTVVGSGPGGYPNAAFGGDGGPATQARLAYPTRLAFDGSGNLYVSDTDNERIRKVDASTQVITTVAGSGAQGISGDGGLATASALDGPTGVAVDASGNLFLSESRNNLVRVVPISGCSLPLIGTQPRSQTIVSGFAVVLSVAATSPTPVTYQWYRGISGDTSSPVAGATAATYTTPPLTATTSYWVRARNDCGAADSDTATVTVAGNLADLTLTMAGAPEPVAEGGRLTFTLVARNNGPTAASGVVVTDTLPGAVTFVSASASQGSCSGAGTVTCALGGLVQGAEARVVIVATTTTAGSITNRARVSAAEPDPDESSNSTQWVSTVSPATAADVAITQSASPDPARVGNPVTLTLFVANNGPAAATGVTVTDTLPAGTTLLAASALLGTCGGTGPVTCTIDSLAAGGSTTVTLVLTPAAAGTPANVAAVSAAQDDPTPGNNSSSLPLSVLTNVAACPAPPPELLSWPDGVVRAGDTFTVSWWDVYGSSDPAGAYRAQLATSPDFAPSSLLLDQTTRNLSISYPTAAGGAATTLHFRIASVAGCGTAGPFSEPVTISVAPNPPALVVSAEPTPAWTVPVGELPPPATVRFRNVGGATAPVTFRSTGSFFTFSPGTAVVAPGQEVTVTLTPLAGSTAAVGSQSGDLTADWTAASVTQTVFLTVAGVTSSGNRPRVDQDEVLLVGGALPAAAPLAPPQASVTLTNSGTQAIFLVPSVSPGGAWLKLDASQFATPLGPGASRSITLAADPSKVTPADYPLPTFTVLTLAAAGGTTTDQVQVKVFYTERVPVLSGNGRGFLPRGVSSFVVPTTVHKSGVGGALFTSDGWLRNLSPDPVTFDAFVTPSGQDGQVNALKVTQTIGGFTTVRLFDLIQALFGTTDLAGPLEIRSVDAAQLSVRTTASGLPGTGDASSRYGTEIPVYAGGSGTGVGEPPLVMTGIKDNASYRLNLIVAETTGTRAVVNLRLFDSAGTQLAAKELAVPALGNVQLSPLVGYLGVSAPVEAASLLVEPVSGTGRVVALGTLIDNVSQSFQGLTGRILAPATNPAARRAAPPSARVIPSIVHSSGIGAFFTTELSITNGTATPAVLHLVYTYTGSVSGTATADVTLGPRASLPAAQSRDAVVNLLGLPPGSNTSGSIRIEGPGLPQVVARATVSTPVDLSDASKGVKGSEFQSYTAASPEAVAPEGTPVVTYPGVQKYAGIRTNLILTEVSGQPARVRLRLVNGATGGVLSEVDKTLGPWEKVQVIDMWNGSGGFAVGDAALDKVSVSMEPIGDETGSVVGALSVIDNVTNSSRILVLAPPGAPQGGAIGF